jgi:quinol monooxygenase YgiN
MYGTVARMHVKPGMQEAFVAWVTDRAERVVPGRLKAYVYQLDADPDTLMLAVLFESREAYQRNAASPEQAAEFETMMQFLAAEPEWHDGQALLYLGGGRG